MDDPLYEAEAKIAGLEEWVDDLQQQNAALVEQLADSAAAQQDLQQRNLWQGWKIIEQARELNRRPPIPEGENVCDQPPRWAGVDFSQALPECPWPKVWPEFPEVVISEHAPATPFRGSTLEDRWLKVQLTGPSAETVDQWAARHAKNHALLEIDQRVEDWHEGRAGADQTLHDFLGMSWPEYSLWVTQPSALTDKQIRHHLLGALRLPEELTMPGVIRVPDDPHLDPRDPLQVKTRELDKLSETVALMERVQTPLGAAFVLGMAGGRLNTMQSLGLLTGAEHAELREAIKAQFDERWPDLIEDLPGRS